ncbi:MAG TPA: phosphate signaling complex protein PhoU [Thermoanaerobaculales bacterium]|nr:phosphate signaling complex protein PhoU [Thermoanaerobaculales bacterium]HPA79230.1 phosphate signaling complex protein PhoU [Thermoanaerobaculales bacterium]HQL28724.1 phosphate signaling complex protein PhoU [Thermoanaerobaculales bacterium]HQN96774.1 phosphate signaling complex protein PhoU [Thermoanaerobaculales bacterium]HQP42926.1 phosphate signaling complex protein PhoU [Thermoanaerobaculales bacterium]
MHRQFEEELEQLKQTILAMAGLVEKSLADAAAALVHQDVELAEAVIARDDEVDRLEIEIDRLATEFIARHQPTATDLRFVIVAIKLGPELERIADDAVNVAHRVRHLAKLPLLKPLIDLPRMLALAHAMVSDAITAYVKRDPAAAREIIRRDDEVDTLYWQVFRELLTYMMEDPSSISRAIDLILVARFIERIADQATNIAEEVVYLVEAVPIRHRHDEPEKSPVGE